MDHSNHEEDEKTKRRLLDYQKEVLKRLTSDLQQGHLLAITSQEVVDSDGILVEYRVKLDLLR